MTSNDPYMTFDPITCATTQVSLYPSSMKIHQSMLMQQPKIYRSGPPWKRVLYWTIVGHPNTPPGQQTWSNDFHCNSPVTRMPVRSGTPGKRGDFSWSFGDSLSGLFGRIDISCCETVPMRLFQLWFIHPLWKIWPKSPTQGVTISIVIDLKKFQSHYQYMI